MERIPSLICVSILAFNAYVLKAKHQQNVMKQQPWVMCPWDSKSGKRKYPINTSQQNLVLIFDLNELYALRELVLIGSSNCKEFISLLDFGLPISLNWF